MGEGQAFYIREKFSVQFPYHLDIISMSSEGPLKVLMLNFLFGVGGRVGRGKDGRQMVGYSGCLCLICNRNKNKAHYPNSRM